jgi:penicillin-binding protein 2
VFGAYAPGSTFKPVATLGTLRAYPEYAKVHHDCPGYHMIGKRKMRCNSTHGDHLSIRQALEHSCNVYMYKMVLECGYEPIYEIAREFGLGQYAGLFPDLEMPNDPEKERLKYGNLPETALNDTDSCNLSIGQGALQVAPLQMAMVAATIANGGILYRPRLVQKFRAAPDRAYQTNPTWTIRRMDIPAEALAIVRGGMHDVIMSGNENAKQVQVGDVVIAGKTGTAEYGKNPDGTSKKNTWMISYAPFDHPRYAIAMIVEDGIYGGTTVAPRLHKLYAKLFEYDGTIKKEDA